MSEASSSSGDSISLVGQMLLTVPQEVVAQSAATCTKLDLSENKISSVDWLSSFKSLKELVLDHNGIHDIKGWPVMPSLETLWMNNNKVDDLRAFLDSAVKCFPNLIYLSMMKNPVTPDMYFNEAEAEAYQRFRYYVIYRMPKLQFLDASPIDDAERKEALRIGHLMLPARPQGLGDDSKSSSGGSGHHGRDAETYSMKGLIENKDTKVATFLVKSKPRYDGSNSEGNRFITNDSL